MSTLNWAIIGTGNIAGSMAEALAHVPGARRYAVASRKADKSQAFAAQWGFDRAYGNYGQVYADPDVDIVYVATPNALHKKNILGALAAGKHVLCEKPMTLSADDSQQCFDAAAQSGLVLMEALWSAFFPAMQKAIELVSSGKIGTPRYLDARFVSFRDPMSHPNLFDPALGGGASQDLGIYPVAAALLLAGPVQSSSAQVVMGATGVDEMVAMSLTHENDAVSQIAFGFRAELPIAVRVVGDIGEIEIAENFHHPQSVTLRTKDRERIFDLPSIGRGYAHEAIAFQNLIGGGLSSESLWPASFTVQCQRILQGLYS
ncbi:MAG: Gfo/Idh/MocA family oxidoreductase [Pseudomonadota bacterium]